MVRDCFSQSQKNKRQSAGNVVKYGFCTIENGYAHTKGIQGALQLNLNFFLVFKGTIIISKPEPDQRPNSRGKIIAEVKVFGVLNS